LGCRGESRKTPKRMILSHSMFERARALLIGGWMRWRGAFAVFA